MSCHEVQEFLDAYVDRELDVVTSAQLERHFTECPSCRATSEAYQKLRNLVQAQIPYFRAPEELEQRIRASLHTTERKQNKSSWGEWFPHWRRWAIAGAVVVLLVFGAAVFQMLRRSAAEEMLAQEVVSSHIRSLMADHLSDIASSDRHTVKPWFSGKLDFAPVVKELSSKGFPLAGGRLDYLDNRPVAALVYKHNKHTINLFLWPSAQSDSAPRAMMIRGYTVMHWTQSLLAYWAVSDINAAELSNFVRDLKE